MLSLEAGVIHIYFCFLFVAGVSSGVAKLTLIGSAGTEEALLACLSTESLSSEFLPLGICPCFILWVVGHRSPPSPDGGEAERQDDGS